METKHSHRILLVALNSAWYQSSPALYHLREAIADLGHDTRILSLTVNDLRLDALKAIHAARPEVVCFSAYIWNRMYIQDLLPDLKALLPHARFVAGGPEAAALADLADIVIEGPGEAAFRELAIHGFKHPFPLPPPFHLKDLPFQYRPDDLDDLRGRLLYYECSRGCPYSCAYCLSATDDRNEYRFDPENMEDLYRLSLELDALEALEPRTVKLVDRSFNLRPAFSRALWTLLLSKPRSCEFHFEIYPELLCEEDILLLEGAPQGLIRFEAGVQSTDDSINLASGRRSDWARAKAMLNALRDRTKVVVHTDLLCGLPEQNMDHILASIDELAPCLPEEIQLGMLKVLPDTPMREIAASRGWIWSQNPPYTVLQTDTMSFIELRECEDLARLLNLYWNKGEFRELWKELLADIKASAILIRLLDWHIEHGLPLHSIPRGKREEVFRGALF